MEADFAAAKLEPEHCLNARTTEGRIRCAIYARTARAPGTESIEKQIMVCRSTAAEHDWLVNDEFIAVDEGTSGDTLVGGTGLRSLVALAKAEPRPFDFILCSESTRVGRNLADVSTTIQSLHDHGVHLYCAETGLDSRSVDWQQLLIQSALTDEIYRWSHMPVEQRCCCACCEFSRMPLAYSIPA